MILGTYDTSELLVYSTVKNIKKLIDFFSVLNLVGGVDEAVDTC